MKIKCWILSLFCIKHGQTVQGTPWDSQFTEGRVMHMCISKLTNIGSDNGLLPGWRQAIIWTNAGMLLIGPLGTHRSEILIETDIFSFKKTLLKMPSANMAAILSQDQCVKSLLVSNVVKQCWEFPEIIKERSKYAPNIDAQIKWDVIEPPQHYL